ncbi:MAG TPA: M23 family metallopeptidase [Rhizomicrobium sp.]|jgi:murein DD-endopeptidase MepM/ murein hydrolase activator NlpD|nr:M23 family metallopeptidase [Rhizomicrobium sp.]
MPDLGAGTDRAQKNETARNGQTVQHGNLASVHPFAERVWHWLHAVFPERQIYIRSDGRVQFFTFSSSLQATLAGLVLIFLGWVAFASVNVIFKDHIIAAKDRRYQTMQAQYENRVADLQLSYDELNGALVAAGDRFKATADELEAKQNSLARLIGQKKAIDNALSGLRHAAAPAPKRSGSNTSSDSIDGFVFPAPQTGTGSELSVLPQPAAPQPRTAKPSHAGFGDMAAAIYDRVTSLFSPKKRALSAKIANHPALRALEEQTARLQKLSKQEDELIVTADAAITERTKSVERVMRLAGVNPQTMQKRAARANGADVGGPLLPISEMPLDGIRDAAFRHDFFDASAALTQLKSLFAAMVHIPLAGPIAGPGVELTSDFGARVDPFTGRAAFHAGLDFGGPWGAKVRATAPGTVVHAGPDGAYGNMVEIDHGMGVRTRYGHLSAVLVRRGAHIGRGDAVGRLGSTGRSTGPHVHYEVWLDNRVRDPAKFLEAGRHVLE